MPQSFSSISIVVPVYNGAASIGSLIDNVISELSPQFSSIQIVIVNDNSPDDSDTVLQAYLEKYPAQLTYIRLMRNFGEHNAVMCGLNHISGDCVAIIDDDFQNPPAEILKLVSTLEDGYDVVYSYYEKKQHSVFRNLGSAFNDLVANVVLEKPKGLYLSSFKVINAKTVEHLIKYQGPFPYIDGLILQTTTNIGTQLCEHNERSEGESGYTLRKLVRLWLNMFTGYSVIPLRIASLLGIIMSGIALLMTIIFIIDRIDNGVIFAQELPVGWASQITATTFFAGAQLLVIGLLGEYLGRLFLMASNRPQYLIRTHSNQDEI